MRVIFAGTPEFARLAYEAIVNAGHEVPLVLTQPDRPSGRGLKLTPSPVKQEALAQGAQVLQPQSLRLDGKYPDEARQAQQVLQALAPDVMVVAAYGLILPQWVLDLPKYGCLNIHASLLPRWRGAAPIQRAIEAGDAQTGVAIMQMDAGLDTGDVLLEKRIDITDQTAAVLHDQLAAMGAECITAVLGKLGTGELKAVPQPKEGVTYAAKLEKSEAPIDIKQDAPTIARRIRAFNPVPGATLQLPGLKDPVKVWQAVALNENTSAEPGTVLRATADGVDIATGQGVLRLLELQKAGGKRQPVAVFVTGWKP
ncbi:methionyl-tRNA formyltransferase [Advenella alkanexedens]|uniref:Methionyl-tRNA formyltransferase n=1 Tax=Advenella alkanexedens TaxID=1481665 RepID=A0ABS6NL68_9BURK|nr:MULTISPECIES: methionyl-tRNA formyltransferase [Advenella]MBV4396285.1 methionyl-tRNA formyltransferase [Advenella alkanexedens]MDD3757468.1 methionyl-tRNA formyltransferase [Advenella sp.]